MSTGMQDKCRSSLNTLLWLFFTAACIRDMSCFQIDRRVTSKSILPYPSADRFSNPRKPLCMFIYTSCNKYSAKCSGFGSCCRCECRGHTPNFLSSTKGCVNAYSLGTKRETSCIYLLKNSGEMYVPTFTSYTDFQVNNITLQISPHSLHSVLYDGNCKTHSVHYIDRRGRKRLLFKNDCSEIFEIEKQVNEDKEVEQLLKWKVTLNPSRYFHKMQGKLLRLGISCENAGKRTDSCLLFKVGGSYNDNLNYHAVESPRVCPTRKLFTPTKTTTSKETTKSMVKKTTVAKPLTQRLKPEEPITVSSNSVETERPLVQYTTDPTSGIQPPASLPDVETTGPDTIETAASKEPSASDGLTDAPITTTWKQDKDEGSNTQVSKSSQSTNKRGINWLVTGLIIAVAILLVTLAASLFVLLRKRCTKRAQRNSGEFAMNVVYHGSPTSPEYDEATLPSKRDCEDDEVDCYADGNLYESIDNLNVKGATADAYEYAYKVNLPDENSNKEQSPLHQDKTKMKIFLVLSLAALAIASEFKMKLEENGERFAEEVIVDVAGQTEEIKVPQHQDRMEVDILNDFNVGLQALKIVKRKECLISAIDASEESPAKLEKSMRLAHSKFPYDEYMVKNERLLQVRNMSPDEVGEKIARHCKGNKLIFAVKVTKDNAAETIVRMVKDRKSKSKRNVGIRNFTTCTWHGMTVVNNCPPERLGARCSFYRTDQRVCAYEVTCQPTSSGGLPGADCIGQHKFTLRQCCDFVCL